MTDPEADYSRYTLTQLLDARRWIEPERFPERAAAIEREIRRREEQAARSPGPEDAPEEDGRPRWRKPLARRGAAFLIDFLLFVIVWSGVEILFLEHRSELERIALTWPGFVLYYLIAEGMTRRKASPGKRLAGLSVVRPDGGPATRLDCLWRAVLAGSLTVLAWDQLVHHVPAEGIALWTLLTAVGMLRGLSAYNLFLALRDPRGRMLQDRITGTRIIDPSAGLPPGRHPAALPADRRMSRPLPRFLILAAFLLVSGGLYGAVFFHVNSPLGGDSWSVLGGWQERRLAGSRAIQEGLDRVPDLNGRAELGYRIEMTGDGETRTLVVSVRIPPRQWGPAIRERVREAVRLPAGLETDGYDRGVLVLWTGTRFLRISRTLPLELAGSP